VRGTGEGDDAQGECDKVSGDLEVYGGALCVVGLYESADPGDGDEYQFDVWRRGEDADGSVGLLLIKNNSRGYPQKIKYIECKNYFETFERIVFFISSESRLFVVIFRIISSRDIDAKGISERDV